MTVKNTQLETPFSTIDKAKLDGIEPGAQPQPDTASQAEAEAGVDNVKMMTPLRVAQAIAAQGGGGGGSDTTINGVVGQFLNDTGSTLTALTLVSQDSSGNMISLLPSDETQVLNILGVLTADTATGNSEDVLIQGLIQNITTSFILNDILYLAKDGTLTNSVPDIGTADFDSGDFIVRVGKITKNETVGSQKDLLVDIEIVGQL